MKKILLILAAAVSTSLACAQNIAIGERAPEIKSSTWLKGQQPQMPLTYICFVDSSNKSCTESLPYLNELSNKFSTKLAIIIVTKEQASQIEPLVGSFIDDNFGVAIDSAGKTFAAYGVNYVPFGILVDSKKHVAWMGGPRQLTPSLITKIAN